MNQLHVDRAVEPGGETEQALNDQLFRTTTHEGSSFDVKTRPVESPPSLSRGLALGLPDRVQIMGRDPRLFQAQAETQGPTASGTPVAPVQPPAMTPQRTPAPEALATMPPPPGMTPEREPAPPPVLSLLPQRDVHFPPLESEDAARRQGFALAGEPVPYNIGERLVRMSLQEARHEAETIAGEPVPDWKRWSLEPAHWAMWADTLDRSEQIGPVQRAVFLEIFAAEGGFAPDGSTVAGIASVADIADAIGVPADTSPTELSAPQLVKAYRAYFDLS